MAADDTKTCPFCGETIKFIAVKCRFCRSMLDSTSAETRRSSIAAVRVGEPPTQAPEQVLTPPTNKPVSPKVVPTTEIPKTQLCPACGKEIKAGATRCGYCWKEMPAAQSPEGPSSSRGMSTTTQVGAASLAGILIVAGLVLLFYPREKTKTSPTPAAQESGPAVTKEVALARVVASVHELCETHAGDTARKNVFDSLVQAVDAASPIAPDELRTYREIVGQTHELDRRIEAIKSHSPDSILERPEKPEYEKPEYNGAWYLSGQCRGKYDEGGIIVQRGDRYFVVSNADPCLLPYVHGYVVDDGKSITLNLGHSGRYADILRLVDRETYVEDQNDYRRRIAEAQAEFKEAVKTYPARLATWELATAQSRRALDAREAETLDLVRQRDGIIDRFANSCSGTTTAIASAPSPTPAVGAVQPGVASTETGEKDKQVTSDPRPKTAKLKPKRAARKDDDLGF